MHSLFTTIRERVIKLNSLIRTKSNSPDFLIKAVAYSSIFGIFLSVSIILISNKKDRSFFSFYKTVTYTDRFIAKHDNIRMADALTKIIPYPVENSLLQQGYSYYLAMRGEPTGSSSEINSTTTYFSNLDKKSIDAVGAVSNNFLGSYWAWSNINDNLLWLLVISQILNIFFSTRLFYVERRHDKAKTET